MCQFSQHFIEQMQIRNIDISEATDVLNNPQHTIKEGTYCLSEIDLQKQ